MTKALKPCPCCQSSHIESDFDDDTRLLGRGWVIDCLDCGIAARRETEDLAVASWNQRGDVQNLNFINETIELCARYLESQAERKSTVEYKWAADEIRKIK